MDKKRKRQERQVCTEPGCGKWRAGSHGYCIRHAREHNQPLDASRLCTIEGCTKGRVKGGMCIAHGKENNIEAPVNKRCTIEGCTKQRLKGGMCRAHGKERDRKVAADRERNAIIERAEAQEQEQEQEEVEEVQPTPKRPRLFIDTENLGNHILLGSSFACVPCEISADGSQYYLV